MERASRPNPYENLRYALGFLLTSGGHSPPHDNWSGIAFGRWALSHDPRVRLGFDHAGERWAFVLGRVIDIDRMTQENATIAETLLERIDGPESVYEYLDGLSGRYIVGWGTSIDGCVTSDACGVRSLFYHAGADRTVASSHAELVANVIGDRPSRFADPGWASKHGVYYLPGDATPYADIRFLTPNLELDLQTNMPRRYYPRVPIALKTPREAADSLADILSGQLRVLSQDTTFVVSLSAGIDSRATLAMMRPWISQTTFFTYFVAGDGQFHEDVLTVDRDIGVEMARNLRLDHEVLEFGTYPVPRDLQDVIRSNSFIVHNRALAAAYIEHLPDDALHLRSNLVEIGRAFFRKAGSSELPLTPERMAATFSMAESVDQEVVDEFSDWAKRARFEDTHGFDPYDMFYWEHRMGTWHSGVVLESDVAFDTFILFNSRRVLELLLSVPLADRLRGSVLRELITREWPVLNYWPINAVRQGIHRFDPEFDEQGVDLTVGTVSGCSVDSGRQVVVAAEIDSHRAKLWMTSSAPNRGDVAEYRIALPAAPGGGSTIGLTIRSPYANDTVNGRLEYQVLVSDQLILREDISSWGEPNSIRIWLPAFGEPPTLAIRVIALRDCEAWSWGRAGRLLIDRLTIAPWPATTTSAVATSPFSLLCVPAESRSAAPG